MATKDQRGNIETAGTSITLGKGGANELTIIQGANVGAITITLPASTATLLDTTSTQTLSNKTLDNTNTYAAKDTLFILQDDGDSTKKARFQLSGISTATTRTFTLPDADTTIATFSAKLSAFASTTSAELATVISDETGSGLLVFATSPTLTTPVLGVASATSINKVALTAPATGSTLTIADGKTLTASNTLTFSGTDGSSVVFGAGGTVTYTSNKLSVFAATTSSELASVISDETGSGALVFATSPTLVTPTLGVASATSINKLTLTAPATGSTLTIADGKTLTASNTLTFTGTDSSSVAFGAGGTVAYTANKLSAFAATTSAELAGVISDESGSGSLLFGTSPTLTTPTLAGGTASNTSRWTVPSNTLANLTALTRVEGVIVYATDTDKFYSDDGTNLNEVGGSGSGSGSLNIVDNPSAASATTGWTAASNYTVSRDTSNSPLAGIIDTCFAISTTTASSETSTSGVYAAALACPPAIRSTKLQVSMYVVVPASSLGVWRLSVYNSGGTRVSLSSDSSSVTTLPAGFTGQFNCTFDGDTGATYTVSLTQTTRSSANTLYVTNIVIGNGIITQGAAVSDPVAVTFTGTWVSNATYTAFETRIGSWAKYDIKVALTGAPTATALTLTLPSGRTINTAALPDSTFARANVLPNSNVGISDTGTAAYMGAVSLASATTIDVSYIDDTATAVSPLAITATAPITFANTDRIVISFMVPIAEWAGNGTVNLGAGAQVEYLSSGFSSWVADRSPAGTALPTTTPAGSSEIVSVAYASAWQYPQQVGDRVWLEIQAGGVGPWLPCPTFEIDAIRNDNTNFFGLGLDINSTNLRVIRGKYRGGTVDTWATMTAGTRYRLVKANPSSPVGFGLAGTDGSSGLYKAGSAPGLTTGAAIASGYVGEKLTASLSNVTLTASGTTYNAGSLVLTAGTWVVYGKVSFGTAGSTQTQCIAGISTTSATLDNQYITVDNSSGIANGRHLSPCPYYISTTGTTIYLVANSAFTGTAPATGASTSIFYAVRIA